MKTSIIIITILVFTFCSANGQQKLKTKKVVRKFEKTDQVSENYYIVKSGKRKIKHGEYVSYFKFSEDDAKLISSGEKNIEDFIKENGIYSNGLKVGDWIENINKNEPNNGFIKNGAKEGIWHRYKDGKRISSFDYTNDRKVGIWIFEKEYGLVMERFDHDLNKQLHPVIRFPSIHYPKEAFDNEIQGKVVVRYRINSDCIIDNIQIVESLSPECDKEALRSMEIYAILYEKYEFNCESKIDEKEIVFVLTK